MFVILGLLYFLYLCILWNLTISFFLIKAIENYGNKTLNVFVLSLEEYLRKFWLSHIPEVMELYESLTASLETKVKGY